MKVLQKLLDPQILSCFAQKGKIISPLEGSDMES